MPIVPQAGLFARLVFEVENRYLYFTHKDSQNANQHLSYMLSEA
jgi:hypothetical protein